MSGRLFDLASSTTWLPNVLVLDTTVVVAWMLAPAAQSDPMRALRAATFFHDLLAADRRAILTPTAYSELLHISLRLRYQRELRANQAGLQQRHGKRITSWTELHKREPTIAQQHASELTRLRQTLVAANIVIAEPDDLGPIPSRHSYSEELVRLVGRYGLDTSDAVILMEASRLGVTAIVTMDRDLLRAQIDFDVYTWR